MREITVAAALIRNGKKFLICRRPIGKSNGGLWEFPGGKLESGETSAEAAVRECFEELALELIADPVPLAETVRNDSGHTIRLILHECRIAAGTLTLLEHSEARWITEFDLPKYDLCPADFELVHILFPNLGS